MVCFNENEGAINFMALFVFDKELKCCCHHATT
jgi:hypothetical protein